ncbi:DNA double-strand break repair nuclease NurA [Methanocalculus chunghsingensis]|uniref:DNA double-strand break repair nuclease NurA n=1 Tax=Methanocalculus chunghsingensis TaxID=156457 RepID=UPI001B8CF4C7|nr:DNA double-strand break repair nuclease NurA [Methanocalculus chunghsingensis]
MNGAYIQDLIRIISDIRQRRGGETGADLLEGMGIQPKDFIPIQKGPERPVSAVDGSNATVYQTPFFSIIACRGALTRYRDQDRDRLSLTPWRLCRIGEGQEEDFAELFLEFFGRSPDAQLQQGDTLAAEAAFRDTIEYGLSLIAAREASPGSLLLLDGALYAEHPAHREVLTEIMTTCRDRGLLLAAVTKNAGVTWDAVHPLVPSVMKSAGLLGIRGPWYLRFGEVFVTCLHHAAKRAFMVTIPSGYSYEETASVFSALASYAGDGRVTGYPYPLMDAHRQVAIRSDQVQRIRQDIIAGCATQSIGYEEFEEITGDYHDELNRY